MNAHAAALGIGYQLWLRSRWLLLGTLSVMIIVSTAVHLAASPGTARVIALLGSLPLGLVAAILVGIFSYSGDMSTTESGYPRHMLALPLSNRALVLGPMLYGIGCLAILWMMVAWFILLPAGLAVPVIWPVATLAAILAWLQATSWSPFWFNYARVAACILSVFAVISFTLTARSLRFPEVLLIGGLLAATGLAIATAIGGVARARRGDGSLPHWLRLRAFAATTVPRRAPFASGQPAQLWLELRRNFAMLPIFILPVPAATLAGSLWPWHRVEPPPLYLGIVPVQFLWAAVCLAMPPFMASAVGGNLGKLDAWGKHQQMLNFVAVRPMADAGLIKAKLKAAALSVGITWVIVLSVLTAAWSLPHSYTRTQSLVHAMVGYATFHRVVTAIAVLLGLVLMTWLNVIQSFAISLYGRSWLNFLVQFLVIAAFIGVSGLGYWIWLHPRSLPLVLHGARVAMWALVGIKFAIAALFIRGALRSHVATPAQFLTWSTAWLLALAAVLSTAYWLHASSAQSAPALAAGLLLYFPCNSLIAMPLAWHHNRHR